MSEVDEVFTIGLDGLRRSGPESSVEGCPSNECQIRRQCTGAAGCMREMLEDAMQREAANCDRMQAQRDDAIASYDALGEAIEKHLPASVIPSASNIDRVCIAGHLILRLTAVRPVLDDMARSFSASTVGEPHEVALRVAHRVTELQEAYATVSRSRDRWRAMAKRLEGSKRTRSKR